MSGTRKGGLKSTQTIYKKYGRDYFKKIGADGGKNGTGGAFKDREFASRVGKIGGQNGSRKGIKNGEGKKRKVNEDT